MPYLTNLADVARRTGYPVTEVAGWKSRGHGPQPSVQGIVCHHTAGRNDMHVVRDGRPGLTGPLSQFWLRHDGHIFVIAAGRCWHNAPSTSNYHRNDTSLGIEAENNGSEPWPAKQVDAYQRLCAELCRAFKLPASRVKGHKEVNTQKPDPHSINMDTFRARVDLLLKGEDDVSAKDMWTYEIPVPYGSKENPEWQARNILTNHGVWLRKISTQIGDLSTSINRLVDRLEADNAEK
ncbi:N-acetylmuramyl-L-alanine amidase, negative regulator of AmpC, AmpD [Thermobispora bispora DSM 43833]|uniref:N-acetylmuramoyl-L-alanine amidase n=1 Tax=Thermobispora bispora (strain ATCC 19993 / DSM 43833 / CBS 139.67 / JCM 10125 / KCTC 9307 / NBRC 14880 / R51) TaxID=469371 RepID=D6Y323_THEBD|nr:N-acetylmuramyl-L-alanine amidase, negative regulator of AmpC, AmpD [Thermobispora bispora DSM 43833]HLT11358.1 N-acetylmuramoyl-L-alanine amidase [Micromonosporaceae bacterium]